MQKKMKCCPFCGGTELRVAHVSTIWVACNRCGTDGPHRDTRLAAIRGWNKRHDSTTGRIVRDDTAGHNVEVS